MNLKLNNNFIDSAMKFYDIQDNEYKIKCYECINEINNNKVFKEKLKEIYHILYLDNTNKISELWKEKELTNLFGKRYHPFITNVLLLLGYKFHINNMKLYNLDENQINIHKKRVKESLINDIKIRNYDGIRISQMLWGAYFINLRIIEVGRLQYELIKFNPLNESEEKKCLKIHIPAGEKLDINKVKISLKDSKNEIKKYFNLENPEYYCTSWLLSRQINSIIDKNSNIAKFYSLFDVEDSENGINDILNFVYNIKECDDYNKLPENTSLQRKVKRMLIFGNKIKLGQGVLKKN